MRTQRGVAVIAGLLVMAAVMALGLGTMFLTEMNLRISENARSNALAKAHAEAGLEAALALLRDYNAKYKEFPSASFTLPETAGQSYRLLEYARFSNPARVRVRVEGFTANNASYIAEALFATDIYRAFLLGLTSEQAVSISGGGNAEFLNAGIHANNGVNLSGFSPDVFRSCPLDSQGNCLSAPVTTTPTPVSTSYNNSCSTPCPTQHRNEMPMYVDVDYIAMRNKAIRESYVPGGWQSATNSTQAIMQDTPPNEPNTMRCTSVHQGNQTFSAITPGTASAPNVICVENGSVTLPANVNLTGLTIIADGNINFGSTTATGPAGNLTDVKLISKNGGVMLNKVVGTNLTIFTGANRDVGSTNKNKPPTYLMTSDFDLRGYATIASSENIEWLGKSSVTVRPDTTYATTISVISQKDIINGGSFDYYGTFWAGGRFHQNGSSIIYGSVATKEGINITGKLTIRRIYAVDNPFLLGNTEVLSRR